MYADRRNVKSNCHKVSLNDMEKADLEAEANRRGFQSSAFIRKLAMEQLERKFKVNPDGSVSPR